jgi:ribosomal 50S subunit-recycling heat shock protein
MSIHVILGKPGSGKSLFATKKIIRELRESKRNIVTNVPLNIDKLNEWVQKKFPNEDLQVPQRVRMLSDDELKRFWEFRGPGSEEEWTEATPPKFEDFYTPNYDGMETLQILVERELATERFEKTLKRWLADRDRAFMAFGDRVGKNGVCYLLDECHIAFNARDWATIGRGALHYLSQHRKLGDIVYPITQSPGNLDKQFRSVAEDFTVLRNEYTAKFGVFKGRGRFTWKTYLHEPTTGNKAEPFISGSFVFNGEEHCYDTARGIGVHGNKADIGRRAKGIPIMWVIPMGLCLALSCVAVPWFLGKKAGDFVTGGKIAVNGVTSAEKGKEKPKEKDALALIRQQQAIVPEIKPLDEKDKKEERSELLQPKEPAVYPTGYVIRNRKVNVTMSNGTVYSEADNVEGETPVVDKLTRTSVNINGKKMWFKGSPSVTPQKPITTPPQSEKASETELEQSKPPEVAKSDYKPIMPQMGQQASSAGGVSSSVQKYVKKPDKK